VFEVSGYTGTSVAMIDRVYGHLVWGHLDTAAARLDADAARECATSVPRGEIAE
jgi:hypothetical protein